MSSVDQQGRLYVDAEPGPISVGDRFVYRQELVTVEGFARRVFVQLRRQAPLDETVMDVHASQLERAGYREGGGVLALDDLASDERVGVAGRRILARRFARDWGVRGGDRVLLDWHSGWGVPRRFASVWLEVVDVNRTAIVVDTSEGERRVSMRAVRRIDKRRDPELILLPEGRRG